MTKQQSSEIVSAIDKIIEGLGALRRVMAGSVQAEKPESGTKPVQLRLDLPETIEIAHRGRLGDVGYENDANPNRQAVGQIGGLATAGLKRAPCLDKRRRGSVMVKDMAVNEKRRYWRWAKDRAKARMLGATPPSWNAWTAAGDSFRVVV